MGWTVILCMCSIRKNQLALIRQLLIFVVETELSSEGLCLCDPTRVQHALLGTVGQNLASGPVM